MSLQFNDTANQKGIIQFLEKELGFDRGDISGNATKFKQFTADINLVFDKFWAIAIPASGKWQLDDSNQTDYPIITANLEDGRRDYPFVTDESGNLILDIYRVFVKSSATTSVYDEIFPVDQQSDGGTEGFTDGQNTEGIPYIYDKTANGIFLDPIPSYNATNGLKAYINREASYFTTSDTTKKPGVPGLFHDYFFLKPAREYARRKSLASFNRLDEDVLRLEKAIKDYYTQREKDTHAILQGREVEFE